MKPTRFIDTHCHIHDTEFLEKFNNDVAGVIERATAVGVDTFVCVGTDAKSSEEAVLFSEAHPASYATVALHPHEVATNDDSEIQHQLNVLQRLLKQKRESIIGIGECGLDYYYHAEESIRERQKALLQSHISLAQMYDLPLVFHVRDAFDDFFAILDRFTGIRGVVHSFSAGVQELEGVLARGLYVGLNGIITFSKQKDQLQAAEMVPLERMVLETDAPFLTPAPFRGKMCEPRHVCVTAEFLAGLRGETLEAIAMQTTANAQRLFGIK
jgi:TatD DNase family protein